MENKKKNKKRFFIIAALIPVVALLFGVIGGVTYAIVSGTRAQSQHGFKVSVRAAETVSAYIQGTSYYNADTVEQISLTYDKSTATEQDGSFEEVINIDRNNDVISFEFKIYNTTGSTRYTDLIVEPSYTLEDANNVISTMYVSLDGASYDVQGDKYFVVHKDGMIYVRLEIKITEVDQELELDGNINFNLFSEDGLPEGFDYDKTYRVEDGIAYVTEYCPTCGAEHKAETVMEADSYVIANDDPDSDNYAQKVLDSDINGKVVIFDGTFDEVLEIRPSKATSEVRATNDPTAEVLDPEALDLLTSYYYTRNINDVVFTATEGTVFNNTLLCESGKIGFHAQNSFYIADRIDAVKGVDSWTDNGEALTYYASINMENIKYTNMKFFGKHASIVVSDTSSGEIAHTTKNIVISNCEFNDNGATYGDNTKYLDAWGSIYVGGAHPSENIVIKNNKVDSCFQGVYVQNVVNVRIYNNEISNSQHNLIAIQSGTNTASQGKILVANNKLSNNADRAMRSLNIENANFEIKNNTFVNCGEVDGNTIELYKVNKIANSTYCFADNTFNGVAMTNIKGNASPITWIIYA